MISFFYSLFFYDLILFDSFYGLLFWYAGDSCLIPMFENYISTGMSNSIMDESVFFLNLLLFIYPPSSIDESTFLMTGGDSTFFMVFIGLFGVAWRTYCEEDLLEISRETSSWGRESLTADYFSSTLFFLSGLKYMF